MNREAVALGVPVYTTFAGRLGAVDETLIREGRLRAPHLGRAISAREADGCEPAVDRDPALLLDLLLTALEG